MNFLKSYYKLSKLVFFIMCICVKVNAQYDEKNFTRYTVKDGLTDNYITCLQQDEQGYMWAGTQAGLNRFDGNRFKKFSQGTPPVQLLSAVIGRLKLFDKKYLGIIGSGGFQLLDTRSYAVKNFTVPDSTSFTTYLNAVWDATKLEDGKFIVTAAAGVYVFDKSGKLTYRHDAYSLKDVPDRRILYARDILETGKNKLLINLEPPGLGFYDTEKHVYEELEKNDKQWEAFRYLPEQPDYAWFLKKQLNKSEFFFFGGIGGDKITYYNYSLKKLVSSSLPGFVNGRIGWDSKIETLNDSTFFISGAVKGFFCFTLNRQTGTIHFRDEVYLPEYRITCLFKDRDNRLWAGSTEGLFKQDLASPLINAWRYQPVNTQGYSGGFTAVYRYKNKLYAARLSYGEGLAVIDPLTMKITENIRLAPGNSPFNEIRSIEMYHPDTLWLGSSGGILWLDTKTNHFGKVVDENKYPLAKDFGAIFAPARKDGYAWMCSFLSGKVARYHIPTRTFTVFTPQTIPALPFEKVKHVVYDSYGDVWVAGHALARWNERKKNFDTLIRVYGGPNKYNDNIGFITADTNGSLWLHNTNNGLLEYRIKEKQFISYTTRDGLPSDILASISPVENNRLWVAGNSQLSLFDIGTKQFTVYDYRDGLPEHRPTSRPMYYDKETGQVYMCANEHITRVPFNPGKEKDRSSSLMIEDVTVNNRKTWYSPEETINISYNNNNLVINCGLIDFEKSNYQFAWRLNNAANWNLMGIQRMITLSNLSPGHYTLEIKASGKPGIEKTTSLYFTIRPPFWKTYWFAGLALLFIAGLVYFLYRRRISYIRQRADIDKQLSQTELKALQAQMNPHFIFNSLNSIREMILNNENKDASHYLSKFAHLIRITLDQSAQSLVSLRNTVDYLQRYMEMEQIRNSHFSFTVTVEKDIDQDDTLIPPMLIQPFIENGLWHGMAANNRAIQINIHFKKENGLLTCMVEDNGIGVNQSMKNKSETNSRHRSHGISNIKNRIQLLNEKHNLKCNVSIRDKQDVPGYTGTGTIVTISLPLEINDV